MFRNLFKDKKNIQILSPCSGNIVAIEKTPDDVFSEKIVGDGFSIIPDDNNIYSPIDGKIRLIFPTLHGIAIKSDSGLEILIHIGIETDSLDGKGFKTYINIGDKIKAGDLLVTFDKELLKEKAESTMTPIVITNMDMVKEVEINYGKYKKKEKIGSIRLR